MARPTVISDELLLSTAREVFLSRGLRATTAEIAEKAGVSQGILFKRFKSKQALFRAAMNVDTDPTQPLPIDLQARVGKGEVAETLNHLGNLMLKKFFAIIPTMMMDWTGSRESSDEPLPPNCGPDRAVQGIQMISSYLREEAALGRLQQQSNWESVAQMFIGSMWHYAFLQVVMGEVHEQPITPEQYVHNVVHALLSGIA